MRDRRGISLAELLVTMSACTAILSLGAVLLHRAIHLQGRTSDFFVAQRSALRLSDQFRSDVHAARSAETHNLPENTVLRLTLGDEKSVDYQFVDGIVQRSMPGGERSQSREQYLFPARCRIAVEEHDLPRRISLTIESQTSDSRKRNLAGSDSPVHLHIESILGRDAKLLLSPDSEDSP
jgi:hypothetical protein